MCKPALPMPSMNGRNQSGVVKGRVNQGEGPCGHAGGQLEAEASGATLNPDSLSLRSKCGPKYRIFIGSGFFEVTEKGVMGVEPLTEILIRVKIIRLLPEKHGSDDLTLYLGP